jgi:hypothetical protein
VRCSEPCLAVATGKLRIASAAKRYRLKKASKPAAVGRRVTLRLKLPAKARTAARRALKKHRKVTVKLIVVVRDAAGNKASKHRTIRLKRR